MLVLAYGGWRVAPVHGEMTQSLLSPSAPSTGRVRPDGHPPSMPPMLGIRGLLPYAEAAAVDGTRAACGQQRGSVLCSRSAGSPCSGQEMRMVTGRSHVAGLGSCHPPSWEGGGGAAPTRMLPAKPGAG